MIISHKHKFIFLHCRKAAGSSIVTSLSRFLGDEDLQFSAIQDGASLKIRPPKRVVQEAMSIATPKDYLAIITLKKTYWRVVSRLIKTKYMSQLGNHPAHAPAHTIANIFPEEWENYFKFCVVRNPWAKTLSDYFWRTRRLTSQPKFDDYVRALENGGLKHVIPENHNNWNLYAINGRPAVDYVIRFENLMEGLAEALSQTSVDWDGWMPHMKKKKSPSKPTYQDHYSEYSIEAVRKLYSDEIHQFNYSF